MISIETVLTIEQLVSIMHEVVTSRTPNALTMLQELALYDAGMNVLDILQLHYQKCILHLNAELENKALQISIQTPSFYGDNLLSVQTFQTG